MQALSQELGNVPRDQLSEEDIGTLFLQIIKDKLLPACKVKGGATAACLTVHCAQFISNFWDLLRDDPDVLRRAVWDNLISVMPCFVRALDTTARRLLSSEGNDLQTAAVDTTLELVNNLIHYDHHAVDDMPIDAVQVLWKMYLVPPMIKGEQQDSLTHHSFAVKSRGVTRVDGCHFNMSTKATTSKIGLIGTTCCCFTYF